MKTHRVLYPGRRSGRAWYDWMQDIITDYERRTTLIVSDYVFEELIKNTDDEIRGLNESIGYKEIEVKICKIKR